MSDDRHGSPHGNRDRWTCDCRSWSRNRLGLRHLVHLPSGVFLGDVRSLGVGANLTGLLSLKDAVGGAAITRLTERTQGTKFIQAVLVNTDMSMAIYRFWHFHEYPPDHPCR